MKAMSIPQSYKVIQAGELPGGEKYITVNCHDYDAFLALPGGMMYDGEAYGVTGWNSDSCLAYYKRGQKFGRVG